MIRNIAQSFCFLVILWFVAFLIALALSLIGIHSWVNMAITCFMSVLVMPTVDKVTNTIIMIFSR